MPLRPGESGERITAFNLFSCVEGLFNLTGETYDGTNNAYNAELSRFGSERTLSDMYEPRTEDRPNLTTLIEETKDKLIGKAVGAEQIQRDLDVTSNCYSSYKKGCWRSSCRVLC